MGVFGTVEIMIHCESEESGQKVFDAINNDSMTEFIKTKTDEPFDFFMEDASVDGETVYVNLSSGRVQHAEWMGEQIRDFVVEKFKEDVYEIQGEVNTPDNYLWWNKEEE